MNSPQVGPYPGDALALERFEREGSGLVDTERPPSLSVVLGRTTPLSDVNVAACASDGVPLFRRMGGGGAVVLGPRTLVLTVCFPIDALPDVGELSREVAGVAASSLGSLAPGRDAVVVRGLGDVCVADRKILGSSFYLKRRMGLYQASLLVLDSRGIISRYLFHPSREPGYRAGRDHSSFVTSLEEQGFPVDFELIALHLREGFQRWLNSRS